MYNEDKTLVTLPIHMYEELVTKAAYWEALDAAGVDNWEGYESAMEFVDIPIGD